MYIDGSEHGVSGYGQDNEPDEYEHLRLKLVAQCEIRTKKRVTKRQVKNSMLAFNDLVDYEFFHLATLRKVNDGVFNGWFVKDDAGKWLLLGRILRSSKKMIERLHADQLKYQSFSKK